MIRGLLLVLMLSILGVTTSSAQKFFETDTAEEAEVKVFAANHPSEADLLVYFVYDSERVVKTGIWMEVEEAYMADVLIIFVDDEEEADLKIWLVDTYSESQWVNEEKKGLLTIKNRH